MKAISLGLLITLTLVSCAEREANDALPEPSIVPTSDIVAESERVYYMVWSAEGDLIAEAEQILLALLEDQIPVLNAWFPSSASPCACPGCAACIVVELKAPDQEILEHGFQEQTGFWVCNCGVEEMWYYSFDS